MRVMAGGRKIDIPTDLDGNVDVKIVRERADVPPKRMLMLQNKDGRNIVLPSKGPVKLKAYSYLWDAPRMRRGN